MVVGFGFVVVFVCNTLQPWISHTKFISHFGKIPFAFHIFFFLYIYFPVVFLYTKKKKCIYFSRRSAVKWFLFVLVTEFYVMWFFIFFSYKKVSKSYQQNHVLYTMYKHVYRKKIIYQKKNHDKKSKTNSLRTSLHSFSCRLFKTYVNILSRAFYYCLRSLSRSRNLTLKACSTAAAAKKRECFENKQKNEGNFFLYIKFLCYLQRVYYLNVQCDEVVVVVGFVCWSFGVVFIGFFCRFWWFD